MPLSTSTWQNFGSGLMKDFQTQYGNQSDVLNYLSGILKPMVEAGGQGFSPQTLAAMRTSAGDTTATSYQNAQKALQTRQAVTGTPEVASGVNAQQAEQLAAAGASQGATAQENITLANEQQREKNLEFATGGLLSVSQQENPLGFAGAANQAGDVAANIENANTTASANSFGGSLAKGLGSSIGSGIGKLATGGVGGVLSGDPQQGISSALYG